MSQLLKNKINGVILILTLMLIGLSVFFYVNLQETNQKTHVLTEEVKQLSERLDNQLVSMINDNPPASGEVSYFEGLPEREFDTLVNLTAHNGQCANVSAQTCYVASNLGKGINLGNIFDAPWEGKWGISFESHYVDEIAAHFNTVRIPVQWSNHAAKTADATLDEAFFERVEMVIDEFLNRGMYVVVDMHHYNQLNGKSPAEGAFWVDQSIVEDRFYNIWKQLSFKLKDKSEKLIFEIINDPQGKITPANLNQIYPVVLESIREYNPDRMVMLMHSGVTFNSESDLDTLIIPDDQNIIIDYHAYAPFKFTHQGLSYMPQNPAGVECCSLRQEHEIRAQLELFSSWSKKVGVPGFIGEFGANSNAAVPSRIEYLKSVSKAIERTGLGFAYWEFGSTFGLYDTSSNTWHSGLIEAITENNRDELNTDKENLILALTNQIKATKRNLGGAAWYRGMIAALALDITNGAVLTEDQYYRLAQESRRMFMVKEQLMFRPPITDKIEDLKRELTIDVFSAAELQLNANHKAISDQFAAEAKISGDWDTFQVKNKENWAEYAQVVQSFGQNREYAEALYDQYINNIKNDLSKQWAKLRESNLRVNELSAKMNSQSVESYYLNNPSAATELVENVLFEKKHYQTKLKKLQKQFEDLSN